MTNRKEYIQELENRVEFLEEKLQESEKKYKDIEVYYKVSYKHTNEEIAWHLKKFETYDDAIKGIMEHNIKRRTGPEVSVCPKPLTYIIEKATNVENEEHYWEFIPDE